MLYNSAFFYFAKKHLMEEFLISSYSSDLTKYLPHPVELVDYQRYNFICFFDGKTFVIDCKTLEKQSFWMINTLNGLQNIPEKRFRA